MPEIQGASNTETNVTTGTIATSETIATSTIPFSGSADLAQTQGLRIRGVFNITGASGTTSVTVKVRVGAQTTSGTLLVSLAHTLAASASASVPFDIVDPTPAKGNNVYTVTLQAAGAAATLNAICVGVEVATQYPIGSA
jgi:hypothetical protein